MVEFLSRIVFLLRQESSKHESSSCDYRNVILDIGEICSNLSKSSLHTDNDNENPLSKEEFSTWLGDIHNYLLERDAGLRSVLLRAVRLSLPHPIPSSSAFSATPPDCPFCALVVSHNVHLIAINSLEKEHNSNWERMQALKLMKHMLEVSPNTFPIGFARSLVAIVQHIPEGSTASSVKQSEDPCKNICVEMLRELSLANVEVAYQSGALRVIFDIILSDATQDVVEPLLMTILYLLNRPHSRRYIRPYLDLQWLISPFTDLESQPAVVKGGGGVAGKVELNAAAKRLQAAKFAFVSLMKSWGGIIALSSNDAGLLSIVRLLSDSKVSSIVKESILDCIDEICEPIVTKLEFNKTNSVKSISISNPATGSSSVPPSPSVDSKGSRHESAAYQGGTFYDDGEQERGSARASRTSRSVTDPEPRLPARGIRKSLSFKKHRRSSLQISSIVKHERQKELENAETDDLDAFDVLDTRHERNLSGHLKHMFQGSSSTDLLRSRKDSVSKPLSVWTRFTSHAELAEKYSVDPIFNMLDNYAGILCCAFMHVKLFDALCWLGTNGDDYISSRGKDILVDLMGVVNKVCTEKICSDLLTLPDLIEYSANSGNAKQRNDRAYKASDLLKSLSNAFSVSKRKEISIHSGSSLTLNKSGNFNAMAAMSKMNQSERRRISSGSHHAPAGRTLTSVAEELLQSSSGLTGTSSGGRYSKSSLAYELKMFLSDSTVDKTEFSKQMDNSRVLGKEGKEPFRWDWAVIGDMLDYSFAHSPDRLSEALKTKFIKRIAGFFRCSVEEKGYFANLEWEPGHLHYFDCSCNLYKILTTQDAGFGFLDTDRRGMLFTEIARDLEAVIAQCTAIASSANPKALAASSKNMNVFRLTSCQQTMGREYFAMVGKASSSPFARKLITKSHLFDILTQTGSLVALDYLSRNVLTSLSFTDGGFISKDLMQIYLTSGSSSTNLRLYSHSLLRALLRSRSAEVCEWGIEVMVQQMMFLHVPRKLIVHCMEEAAQDRIYLGQLIRNEPEIVGDDMVNLSIRFLALPEGFAYLSKLGWIEDELRQWEEKKYLEYSANVEVELAKALNSTYLHRQQCQLATPIPVQISAFSEHPSAPQGLRYPDGGVDLEGLLRLPLNIEAKVVSTSHSGSAMKECRYVKLDSYLDTSELRCPASNEMTSDNLRVVKVRGIVLNAKGEPGAIPLLNDRNIMSCLLCGACPLSKDGRVGPPANNVSKMEKAHFDRDNFPNDSPTAFLSSSGNSSSKCSNMSVQSRRQSFLSAHTGDKSSDMEWCKDQSDMPVSAINSSIHAWTVCKPTHRSTPRRLPIPGDPDRYAVEIPGEPAVFIFSHQPPPGYSEKTSAAVVFLTEIHYLLSLKTGQSVFLPLPRHMYGELARTSEGRDLLESRQIISTLLGHVEKYESGIAMYAPGSPGQQDQRAQSSPAPLAAPESPATTDVISSLWALGHIAAVEEGFQAILDNCPRFVSTCIDLAIDAMSFSVRSCAFSVLGLISRTESGSVHLASNHWEASPIHYVAVAMPNDPSVLFQCKGEDTDQVDGELGVGRIQDAQGDVTDEEQDSFSCDALPTPTLRDLPTGRLSPESRLLRAIGRLPGQLLYKDTMATIKELKKKHPEIFNRRTLYLSVHQLLEKYTFKLSIRRLLLDLFTVNAKRLE